MKPYPNDKNANKIIKNMIYSSYKTNTGPMSCIAGSISYYLIKYLVSKGCKYVIIDNGGDIAIYNPISENNLVLQIYTGMTYFENLGIIIKPKKKIMGICTSSATVGKSISFGIANAVTVISNDVLLADSSATAICNSIQKKSKLSLYNSFRYFNILKKISSIIIIKDDLIGIKGKNIKIVTINNK